MKIENKIIIIIFVLALLIVSSCKLDVEEDTNKSNLSYDQVRCRNFCNDYNLTKRIDYRENFCEFCNITFYNCTIIKC